MKKSYFYIFGAALLFSTMEVALKLGGTAFQPMQLTFLRFFIGGIVLLPFALHDMKQKRYHLKKADWGYLLLLGIINICISMLLFQMGVMRTNANLAALIISANPIFTMIFAQFFVGERFTFQKAIVLILSITGLYIVANPFALSGGNYNIEGVLLTLGAAVTFGLYTALGKKRIDIIGGLAQNSLSFLFGSLILLLIMLITGQPIVEGITLSTLPILMYTGIFVTAIGYFFYLKAIDLSGPCTASMTFFVKPIFAPLVAFFVLGESISIRLVFGILFVLAGSFVNLFGDKIRKKTAI